MSPGDVLYWPAFKYKDGGSPSPKLMLVAGIDRYKDALLYRTTTHDGGYRPDPEGCQPEQRKEIAKQGAKARWDAPKDLPVAKYGSPDRPLRLAEGIEIPCYVLSDGTRVLTQEGFLSALGRAGKAKGGQGATDVATGVVDRMPSFLAAANIKGLITKEIASSTKPVIFTTPWGVKAFGYRAELLPQVCNIYLRARDEEKLRLGHISAMLIPHKNYFLV